MRFLLETDILQDSLPKEGGMSTVTTYPSIVSHVLGLEVCSMLPGEIFMLVSIFTED